jgi:SAM-dependent methyltransferase
MRERALDFLTCPECGGDFALEASERQGGHVMSGSLCCRSCSKRYPISGGIPRLAAQFVDPAATETAGRFGKQWKTFDQIQQHHERNLREWLHPVGPEDFRDRIVLEAGAGKGRHTLAIAGWGARDVVALDLSEAVDVAFRHTQHLENVHVVQGDILHLPLKRVFDVTFSVGVLHHLPDPRAGFDAIARVTKAGGRAAVWVYGYEANEWIVRYVNPVREQVTSKMPIKLLYWMSLPVAGGLAGAASFYSFPTVAEHLPYKGYMAWLAKLPLAEVHNIVFDQLVTPIAFYLPEAEVRSWFTEGGFQNVTLSAFRSNSWRGSGIVSARS